MHKKYPFLAVIHLCLAVLIGGLVVGCSGGSSSSSSSNVTPVVQTSVGSVQGMVRAYPSDNTYASNIASGSASTGASYSVYEYRGIPYALAPTGDLRWAPPQPVTSLGDGVFKAYNFGPACPQTARFNLTEASSNEDCLSINVSTPAGAKAGDNLPVLFWIHGGAFIGGSSSLYRLDKLAGEGRLVVVSINYRLGALGFMPNAAFASGGYNGNYGLEDQRLAMRWVQDNIQAFGGNKNNVTIAGESAGAGSVCMHLASPDRVDGLFAKAITQSAGCMARLPTVTEAQDAGTASAVIKEALCPAANTAPSGVLACMRSKSVAQILAAQENYSNNSTAIIQFSPVTGDPAASTPLLNTTVPSSFEYAASTGKLVSVPMIMGGTKDELNLYVGYFWQGARAGEKPPLNSAHMTGVTGIPGFTGWLDIFYSSPFTAPNGGIAAITNQYPLLLTGTDKQVAETFGRAISDSNPAIGINNCLYLQTSNVLKNYAAYYSASMPIYQFEFADQAAPACKVGIAEPCPTFDMGAVHSSELNYLFPNLSNTAAINAPDLSANSQALSNKMIAYWAKFAYSGNPNVSGLPTWSAYAGANTASVLYLDAGSENASPAPVRMHNSDQYHQCTAFWGNQYSLPNTLSFVPR